MPEKTSENELLNDLRDLADRLERVPTAKDVDKHSDRSKTTYQRRFGSWTEARKAAGLPKPGSWESPKPYENEQVLRRLYIEEDLTQKEVGERLGVSDSTIGKNLRKCDIAKDPGYPWRDKSTLGALYWDEGLSIQDVADELDTDVATIHRWMKRLDVDRRPGPQSHYPWQSEEVLRTLYWERGLNQKEIAEMFDTYPATINKWFREFDIERRNQRKLAAEAARVNRPFFHTDTSGYEQAGSRVGNETKRVGIHRLVVVAEEGFDAVSGKVVHHKNRIPWDNRPNNLVALTDSEHKRLHATEDNYAANIAVYQNGNRTESE